MVFIRLDNGADTDFLRLETLDSNAIFDSQIDVMQIRRTDLVGNDEKARHSLLRAQWEISPFCGFLGPKVTANARHIPPFDRFRARLEVQLSKKGKFLIDLQADLQLGIWSVSFPEMKYWRFEDPQEQIFIDRMFGDTCKQDGFTSEDKDFQVLIKIMKTLQDIAEYRFSGLDFVRGQECELYERVTKTENEDLTQSIVCLSKDIDQGVLVYQPLIVSEKTFSKDGVSLKLNCFL